MKLDLSTSWGYHRGPADRLLDILDRGSRHLLSFGGAAGYTSPTEKIARVPDATREEIVARYIALRSGGTVSMHAIAAEFSVAYCTVVRLTRPIRQRKEAA